MENSVFKKPRYPEEWDWSLLTKKETRELNTLTRSVLYYSKSHLVEQIGIKNIEVPKHQLEKQTKAFKIHSLYDKLGVSEAERAYHWHYNFKYQKSIQDNYNQKPIKERKDNQHPELYGKNTGSGSGGSNNIRFPSKKRSKKTWKNFYKLFPHLDPEREIIPIEQRFIPIEAKIILDKKK